MQRRLPCDTMSAMVRRHLTFTGGIDLPDEKHLTIDSAITQASAPQRLRVPLAPPGSDGPAGVLSVPIGTTVQAGATIAVVDLGAGASMPIVAPLDGKISAITTANIAGHAGLAVVPAVEMTELSAPNLAQAQQSFDWMDARPDELRRRIASAGLVTHDHHAQCLSAWVSRAIDKKCRVLIANMMESQPFVTSDHRLLVEHGPEVMRGLAILALAIGAKETLLAVDHRRVADYRSLLRPARLFGIQRIALSHKYPIGLDRMLVNVLTGREVPIEGEPFDVGVAVVTAATCFAVFRQIACQTPAVGRVVTVSGQRAGKCGNIWAPFGMSIRELVGQDVELPLVHGGAMTGLVCYDDAVVGPSTNAVLALRANVMAPPGPCIRCGWCTDHCPARLNVAALNDMFELGQVAKAARAGALASLGCGVCSYVCPARLPLTQRVRKLKQVIRSQARQNDLPKGK
jgi:electron transport complex protein RnfC